jgi:PleD family two-component response regulator
VLVFLECREHELGGRLARCRHSLRVDMRGGRVPTIVVVHEQAAVLELIEATLRDRGIRVLATLNSLEALEIARRLKVDLLVISRAQNDVARDVRALQPDLSVVVLDDEPMWLDEIAHAVVTALAPRE